MSPPKFKILILGEAAVGKTNIMKRFCGEKFSDKYLITLGVDFKEKEITVDGKTVILSVWDTAGQEQFRALTPAYFRAADGCFIVYDITNKESFQLVSSWVETIYAQASPDLSCVLVGNKTDLAPQGRAVTEDAASLLADSIKTKYIETSAKTKENIDEAFELLTREILKKQKPTTFSPQSESAPQSRNAVDLNAKPKKDKKGCC